MIYLFSLSKNSFLLWAYSQVIDWTRQNTNISNSKQKILWRHSAWNFTKSKGFDRKSLEDLSPGQDLVGGDENLRKTLKQIEVVWNKEKEPL